MPLLNVRKELSQCFVCQGGAFETLYPPTFSGPAENAHKYFLLDRENAVHGRIVRCRNCGFVATSPQFTTAEYAKIYAAVPAGGDPGRDSARTRRFLNLARRMRRYGATGKFLDLGCAGGEFLRFMKDAHGTGFEVRDTVETTTVETAENKIILGDFISYAADPKNGWHGAFDFVTTWDVLEHLPDLDQYMSAIHTVLKDDGLLFCSLPNISSIAARLSGEKWNCILLEHLWYFSPKTFRTFAKKSGFQVLECRPISFPVTIEMLALRLLQIFGWRLPTLSDSLAERVVNLPIGLMFAVCRKIT